MCQKNPVRAKEQNQNGLPVTFFIQFETLITCKLNYRQEMAVSPPGYIQSLMSKIINNISIVCNNVILKYLEEDIVLSLNARTVSLTSVDSKWETAFTGDFTTVSVNIKTQFVITFFAIFYRIGLPRFHVEKGNNSV